MFGLRVSASRPRGPSWNSKVLGPKCSASIHACILSQKSIIIHTHIHNYIHTDRQTDRHTHRHACKHAITQDISLCVCSHIQGGAPSSGMSQRKSQRL